ncbi:MAG: 2,3-bisphosphoglycerate-independent phosphoglycerate mutase [Hymenobacteraceae bacterium]|nr:2,3-bisphosphoglycerate-independent phosphoglycerate mutase [Hymenobacteraceae bacterium]
MPKNASFLPARGAMLIILDGWGLGPDPAVSAVAQARTPYFDSLWAGRPHSRLEASGEAVGLPAGQMGNSEVGHMNLGAGRVVYQDLVRVNVAIRTGELAQNSALVAALTYLQQTPGARLHLLGLVSDGGVHAHLEHVKALCAIAKDYALAGRTFVHAFTDGRDTDPNSGYGFLQNLQQHLHSGQAVGTIASVIGRYYAMDRDNRWERIKLAYDLLVRGAGTPTLDALAAVQAQYAAGTTDEFLLPIVATDAVGQPLATLQPGDVALCFNFRTGRGREITQALTQRPFPEQEMAPVPNLRYLTMTLYDHTFVGVTPLFEKDNLDQTLGQVLAEAGKKQIRIAETEKYPHVTFFFSGGREEPFPGEKRIMRASPKVATYDLAPEMSAYALRDALVPELAANAADFVVLNFANPDMVGHTGVFAAAVRACEVVDECLRDVVETARTHGYAVLVIADHGNADVMINPDGSPNTAHSTNLVPCILVADHAPNVSLHDGKLGDIAPTILALLGLPQPATMTGESLLR